MLNRNRGPVFYSHMGGYQQTNPDWTFEEDLPFVNIWLDLGRNRKNCWIKMKPWLNCIIKVCLFLHLLLLTISVVIIHVTPWSVSIKLYWNYLSNHSGFFSRNLSRSWSFLRPGSLQFLAIYWRTWPELLHCYPTQNFRALNCIPNHWP